MHSLIDGEKIEGILLLRMLLARISKYPIRFSQNIQLDGSAVKKADKLIFPMAMILTTAGLMLSMFSVHQLDCSIQPQKRWFDKFRPS